MSLETLRKKKERYRLARLLEDSNMEAPFPCSHCSKQDRRCVVDFDRSAKCAECIRLKLVCNVSSDPWDRNVPREHELDSIGKQISRLDEQKEEAMAKILRLEKQRQLLKRREKEMVRRGLKFIEELDALEEKEREEKERQEREAAAQEPEATAGEIPFGVFDLPDSFWANPGFADEIQPTSQGS
jgi:hypothetical protein